MPTFRDLDGNEWSVRVTIGTLRRCVEISGVDLLNLFGKEGSAPDEMPPIVRFFNDPDALGRTLFAVVKPEADRRGIDMEAFLDLLSGDTIESARQCLLDACVSFFPSPAQRRAYQTIVEEVTAAFRDAMVAAEREIKPETIRAAMAAAGSPADGEPST